MRLPLVFLGILQFGGGDGGAADAAHGLDDEIDGLLNIIRVDARINPELAGICMGRDERVDRIGQAALLTDFLKEPGTHIASQECVEQRESETSGIGHR